MECFIKKIPLAGYMRHLMKKLVIKVIITSILFTREKTWPIVILLINKATSHLFFPRSWSSQQNIMEETDGGVVDQMETGTYAV